jgi:hypothetical protein
VVEEEGRGVIWSAIIRAITLVVGLWVGRLTARRAGADAAIDRVKDADRERADQIRDRVDAVRREPVSVQPDDTRGYRD